MEANQNEVERVEGEIRAAVERFRAVGGRLNYGHSLGLTDGGWSKSCCLLGAVLYGRPIIREQDGRLPYVQDAAALLGIDTNQAYRFENGYMTRDTDHRDPWVRLGARLADELGPPIPVPTW